MYQPESAAATFSLLRTKLHRPRATHNLVPRPHLIERLNRGRARPLTLVTAPAGYGKTTLVSTWLEDMGAQSPSMPSAWLSLDENDSDVSLFLSYLLAAVRTLIPDFGADTDSLLRGATLPPVSVLATSLTNELDQVDERFVLALDDYHFISAPAVHELLNELLRHPPRSLHLVVMSRRDPPQRF
jgi:LuxR family maltose regulon positive regulatory protein